MKKLPPSISLRDLEQLVQVYHQGTPSPAATLNAHPSEPISLEAFRSKVAKGPVVLKKEIGHERVVAFPTGSHGGKA